MMILHFFNRTFRSDSVPLERKGSVLPPMAWVTVLLMAGGCAGPATLEPGSLGETPIVKVQGVAGPSFKWPEETSATQVFHFRRRFDLHAGKGRAACCASLVRDFPEVALELFRQDAGIEPEVSQVRREQIARAWQSAMGSSVLLETESFRSGSDSGPYGRALAELIVAKRELENGGPQAALPRARAAFKVWKEMGERFFAEDAEQTLQICRVLIAKDKGASSSALDWSGATAPTKPQEAERRMIALQAALLASDAKGIREALRSAKAWISQSSHWLAAMRIEKAEDVALHDISVRENREWMRVIGKLALKRGHPIVALRYALAAARISRQAGDEPGELDDRLLIVRSRLAAQQYSQALDEALGIAQSAQDLDFAEHQAKALAMAGEALIPLDRPKEAVQAFERARNLMKASSKAQSYTRQTINLALSLLKHGGEGREGVRKARQRCKEALEELSGRNPQGLDPKLALRLQLAWALYLLAEGRQAEARPRIEDALREAAAVGDYETVEKYDLLPDLISTARDRESPGAPVP